MTTKKINREKANIRVRVTNLETGKAKTGSYISDKDENEIMEVIDNALE